MKLDTATTIRFSAKAGAIVSLPDNASLSGEKMVEGTINGFPFRAPLDGGRLKLSRAILDASGAKEEPVAIEITRFGDETEVRMPADLLGALDAAPRAKTLYEEITPNARREWVRWIASAKQEVTRKKRIEVGIDKLSKGMRRPCCFPGLNFTTKGLVPPKDTWIALPGAKGR